MDAFRALYRTDIPWWSLIVRAVVVYGAVLALLRVAGKRQVAQMSMTEFVALLLISNAVQNSMNGGDNSLVGGLILAGMLILLATALAYITFSSPKIEQLVQGRPTLLIHRGKIVHAHLKHELLSVRELRHILRKQGIQQLDEVEEAVLESDGFVSVVKKSEMHEDEYQPRNDVY
jgi:uncharacterized membrane protein YcaP (DUF421 family)